jgi:hypothetical protein
MTNWMFSSIEDSIEIPSMNQGEEKKNKCLCIKANFYIKVYSIFIALPIAIGHDE